MTYLAVVPMICLILFPIIAINTNNKDFHQIPLYLCQLYWIKKMRG